MRQRLLALQGVADWFGIRRFWNNCLDCCLVFEIVCLRFVGTTQTHSCLRHQTEYATFCNIIKLNFIRIICSWFLYDFQNKYHCFSEQHQVNAIVTAVCELGTRRKQNYGYQTLGPGASLLDKVFFIVFRLLRKLRKPTINFLISVCLSVRLHGKTRLPMNGF